MDKKYAQYLFKKTTADYNLTAEDFSRTREYVPEDRKELLLKYIGPGDRILDLGCGNGRFFEVFKNMQVEYFGVDISKKMIKIAKEKYPNRDFQVADALSLPFSSNYFDKIFSFAVFHHIPSKEFRLKFLKEAKRVLKPKGIFILTVWNLNPITMILIGQQKRVKGFLKDQILKIFGMSKLDFGDFFISWSNIIPRYIHYFTIKGFKKIVQSVDFKIKKKGILKSSKTKESNIYLVAEK